MDSRTTLVQTDTLMFLAQDQTLAIAPLSALQKYTLVNLPCSHAALAARGQNLAIAFFDRRLFLYRVKTSESGYSLSKVLEQRLLCNKLKWLSFSLAVLIPLCVRFLDSAGRLTHGRSLKLQDDPIDLVQLQSYSGLCVVAVLTRRQVTIFIDRDAVNYILLDKSASSLYTYYQEESKSEMLLVGLNRQVRLFWATNMRHAGTVQINSPYFPGFVQRTTFCKKKKNYIVCLQNSFGLTLLVVGLSLLEKNIKARRYDFSHEFVEQAIQAVALPHQVAHEVTAVIVTGQQGFLLRRIAFSEEMPIQLKYIHPDAIDLDSTFKQCLTELLQRVEVKPKESIAQQAIEEPKSTPSKKKILVRGTRLQIQSHVTRYPQSTKKEEKTILQQEGSKPSGQNAKDTIVSVNQPGSTSKTPAVQPKEQISPSINVDKPQQMKFTGGQVNATRQNWPWLLKLLDDESCGVNSFIHDYVAQRVRLFVSRVSSKVVKMMGEVKLQRVKQRIGRESGEKVRKVLKEYLRESLPGMLEAEIGALLGRVNSSFQELTQLCASMCLSKVIIRKLSLEELREAILGNGDLVGRMQKGLGQGEGQLEWLERELCNLEGQVEEEATELQRAQLLIGELLGQVLQG